jgi:hypothetical protein
MSFQSPQLPLADLLQQVRSGKLQLPDFQREYKWDDDRIRSLLSTLTLGHPMGVLMMLETGSTHTRFKPKTLAGVSLKNDVHPSHLLLDGQQRMTSLFQALTGGRPVETTDARKKKLRRWYYLDIGNALGDPVDRDEAIVSVPADRKVRSDFGRAVDLDLFTSPSEQAAGMFPMSLAFDQAAAMKWLMEYAAPGGLADNARIATVQRFQAEILTPMIGYRIPAIMLGKDTTKEAVCTVFEKVNTGGLALDVFELLTAMFAGDAAYFAEHGTDFRLNDNWRQLKERLDHHLVLRGLQSSDLLQAVTLLATHGRRKRTEAATNTGDLPATSARRADILKLSLQDYLKWAPQVADGLEWAAGFLAQENVFTDADLSYRTQLVPLAVLRVLLGDRIDVHTTSRRVRQWYWCGVLGELYGGAVETRFTRDVEQVPAWALGESAAVPETVARAGFRESRLLSLKTRNSSAYKGLYALMMRGGATDWKYRKIIGHATFVPLKIDVHHIFPKAWCAKNDVDDARRESIVNKTPISYETNRSIGGRSPRDYLAKLERDTGLTAEALDTIVATHHIDPATLRAADFDKFFEARTAALVKVAAEAMGKPVVLDLSDQAVAQYGDDERPEEFEPEPDDQEADDL